MIRQDIEEIHSHQLLLTPEAAAKLLGIGRTKIFELMSSGALESVKIGASRRIPTEALTEFVDRLRNAAAREAVERREPGVAPLEPGR